MLLYSVGVGRSGSLSDLSLLIGSSVLLGLRHGVDWDHIAAISDMVSTGATDKDSLKYEPLTLAMCYSLGHGSVVVVLGLLAVLFGEILPSWTDEVMGRVVGLTLVLLGVLVLHSFFTRLRDKESITPKSRAALLLELFARIRKRFRKVQDEKVENIQYGIATAFGIGMIHGIGAETGTQCLLFISAGGAGHAVGVAMLIAFVAGLVMSNAILALTLVAGFRPARLKTPVLATMSFVTAIFSFAIGITFLLGKDDALPNLQKIFYLS